MGHGAVVRLLLEKGASIEAKDENKDTALYNAAYYGHRAIVKWLLGGGRGKEQANGESAVLGGQERVRGRRAAAPREGSKH
jgi:ankyrin repeat protein